jgi:hypothetical protein
MLLTGFGIMVQHTSSNTVLQMVVDEDKRGRVMSYYGIAFRGMMPSAVRTACLAETQMTASKTLIVGQGCPVTHVATGHL